MDKKLGSVAIFCGSNSGNDKIFRERAYEVGALLAKRDISLIYGGARVGLMGSVAKGAYENGGVVVGVMPTFLKIKELDNKEITKLVEVENMHERKMEMHNLSDGVITLPGGFGTFDELFEMLTWAQLSIHKKPIALYNINGFFDPLKSMLANMVDSGFLKKVYLQTIIIESDINIILNKMESYVAPDLEKWIHSSQDI